MKLWGKISELIGVGTAWEYTYHGVCSTYCPFKMELSAGLCLPDSVRKWGFQSLPATAPESTMESYRSSVVNSRSYRLQRTPFEHWAGENRHLVHCHNGQKCTLSRVFLQRIRSSASVLTRQLANSCFETIFRSPSYVR